MHPAADDPSDSAAWTLEQQNQVRTLLDRKRFVESFWQQQTRPDGRLLAQVRPTRVQVGEEDEAFTAQVHLGDTQVLAAVTLQVGEAATTASTKEATAVSGDVTVQVVDARADPRSHSNRHSSLASSLERTLTDTLDLSQLAIPFESIQEEQPSSSSQQQTRQRYPSAALRLVLTVVLLHHDGNLGDACLLACVAALQQTRLPSLWVRRHGRLWFDDESVSPSELSDSGWKLLQLTVLPVSLTMGVWNDTESDKKRIRLVVDPTSQEEEALEQGRLTVVVNAHKPTEILSVNLLPSLASDSSSLGHSTGVDTMTLVLATKLAAARANEVVQLIASSPSTTNG